MTASLSPLYSFTEKDFTKAFTLNTITKAKPYIRRVEALVMEDARASALVQGTAREPYEVLLEVYASSRGLEATYVLETSCTCPVAYACKHGAALAAVVLAKRHQFQESGINPAVLAWAQHLREMAPAKEKLKSKSKGKATAAIYYVMGRLRRDGAWCLVLYKGGVTEDAIHKLGVSSWNNIERSLVQPPQFVTSEDLEIFRLIRGLTGRVMSFPLEVFTASQSAENLLQHLLATGRLYFRTELWDGYTSGLDKVLPLKEGVGLAGELHWQAHDEKRVVPVLRAQGQQVLTLALEQPWYLDAQQGLLGPLQLPFSAKVLEAMLKLPPISEGDRAVVAAALADVAPTVTLPPVKNALRVIEAAPVPVLSLQTVGTWGIYRHRGFDSAYGEDYDLATIRVAYGEVQLDLFQPGNIATDARGEVCSVKRDDAQEAQFIKQLKGLGFERIKGNALAPKSPLPQNSFGLESLAHWEAFFVDIAPALREAGWHLDVPHGFRHHRVKVDAWHADLVAGSEEGWLGLDLGIEVEGERIALAPLLYELFRREARWLERKALAAIADDEDVVVETEDGVRVALAAGRLKTIALNMIDLFDRPPGEVLALPELDSPRLSDLLNQDVWRIQGAERLQQMVERLRASGEIKPVTPPVGLQLQLRPYQLSGLAWLQHLRANEVGGVLADDMGLGKTAQTLAHLLLEKESGRLNQPVLVILPTSLVFNWKREVSRHAPSLRVLSLHGKNRAESFGRMAEFDICLTTYPLLWRDKTPLLEQSFYMVILDEAQMIKNASSQAAKVVRQIKAKHRLCLTGTPMENHLGELWSLFDFLMPGFLGDSKRFTSTWRTPIEKQGNEIRKGLLAQRLRPFVLRRCKEEVASELPEKTIIVRTVELGSAQRDLYETVRSAMDVRVREEVAAKGLARSQIVILDALLKLRQVCCHPLLLNGGKGKGVAESAKLDLLMDMLPEMVAEGRRVLVFSQFTSMLDKIGEALKQAGLAYLLLTGDTRDREKVVGEFQDGDVPIFLISLKAGGVGLNLTAADTVIHYDPWWNPATENQATDRAHRLGQTRKVFVYKLVVAGSIEEKILALQDRKAALAAGVLGEGGDVEARFTESDLAALLAPLADD